MRSVRNHRLLPSFLAGAAVLLASCAVVSPGTAAAVGFTPGFGVPGLWLSVRSRNAADPKLIVEIGGQPAVVQAVLPNVPQRDGVLYVQVPQGAHSGPVTAHMPAEAPRSIGDLVVTPVVTGHFVPPVGINPRAYHVVSPFGTSTVAADGSFEVPVLDSAMTWLWAVSADPEASFQTISMGAGSPPVISSLTTAACLVFMHPNLLTTQPGVAARIWNAALASPDVASLAARIDAKGASPDLLSTDDGVAAVLHAAESVIAGLPASAPRIAGRTRLLDATPGELRDQTLLGLDAKYVATRVKGDKLPVPRLEFANFSALSRSNLLVEVKEVFVKSTDVKGSPARDWIEQEVYLAPTFDKATKKSNGTLLMPFTTFSSSVDLVGTALNRLGGLIFSQAKYIAVPPDHPGVYVIRAYGGLGALPGLDFKDQRQLVGQIPGGNQKLAVSIISDALDAIVDLLSLIPFNEGKGAKLEREINAAVPISSGVRVLADPALLKNELIVAAADLSVGLTKELTVASEGGSVDPQRIWNLITTVAAATAQRMLTNQLTHAELGAKGEFEQSAYKSWAFGDAQGEADRSARLAAAKAAEGRISALKKLWAKVGILKKAATVGSIAERIFGLIGDQPLETAVLFVNRPLAPQVAQFDPAAAGPGDPVYLGGSFLSPAAFKTRVEFRKIGSPSGIDVGDVLVPTAGEGKAGLGTQVIKIAVPAGASGMGTFHVITDNGEADSPPFTVAGRPAIDLVLPISVKLAGDTFITLFGSDFGLNPRVLIGEAQAPAVVTENWPGALKVRLPNTLPAGDQFIYVKSGAFDLVHSPSKIHITAAPGAPALAVTGSVTINTRGFPGNATDRFVSLQEAFDLVTGQTAQGSLAKRPLNTDPLTAPFFPFADESCSPYAAELVMGKPGPTVTGVTRISFSTLRNFCKPNTPDCPMCYKVPDTPPDSEKAPFTGADLDVPANVSLSLINPFYNAIPVVTEKLTLSHDNASIDTLIVDGGTVAISGKNVSIGTLLVKSPPAVQGDASIGAVAFLAGAEGSTIAHLTVENAHGDAVTFADCSTNSIQQLKITGAGGRGVVFGDGSSQNSVGSLTIETSGDLQGDRGAAHDAGVLFRKGSSENMVSVVGISDVSGDGVRIEDSPLNQILGGGGIDGNTGGGIVITGAGSTANNVNGVSIGSIGANRDGRTTNAIGVEVRNGAHDNEIGPAEIGNSEGDGVFIHGAGVLGNRVRGTQIIGNIGNGITISDGAGSTEILQVRSSGNQAGIRITGGTESRVVQSVFDGNATGVILDGGAARNVFYSESESWGNAGAGVEIKDKGTTGNFFNATAIGLSYRSSAPAGTTVTGNKGDGYLIHDGATGNIIGFAPGYGFDTGENGSIGSNGGDGIRITGANGNFITSGTIGIGPGDRAVPAPNGRDGIRIEGGSQENVVGSMGLAPRIVGNPGDGIHVTGPGTSGNRVDSAAVSGSAEGIVFDNGASGNTIGVFHETGIGGDFQFPVQVVGNAGAGIHLDAPGSMVFSSQAGSVLAANPAPNGTGILLGPNSYDDEIRDSVIAGNTGDGIRLDGSSNNLLAGNWIGLGQRGPVPNKIGLCLINGAQNNVIGSENATESAPPAYGSSVFSNIISGNTTDGILIAGDTTTGNVIRDDWIGVGLQEDRLPNAKGIHIVDAPDNVVGSDTDTFFPDLDLAGLGSVEFITTARNFNLIYGNTATNIDIEGAGATGDVVGNNIIGHADAKTGLGVEVRGGAGDARIGGGYFGPDDQLRSFPNGFFVLDDAAIRIEGSGATGTSALYNTMVVAPTAGVDREDGGVETAPVTLTALSQELFEATIPADWSGGGLVQLYSVGARETSIGAKTYENVDFVTETEVAGPGKALLPLPDAFFSRGGTTQFIATITDSATGITSPFSPSVPDPPNATQPATVTVALSPGLKAAAAAAGQPGVLALALDLTATGPARVTGLRLNASGSGDEAAGVSRIRIGAAAKDSLTLDPSLPLLADLPGYARDNGAIELAGLSLDVAPGAAIRLLVVYDFSGSAPAGTYSLRIGDAAGVSALTAGTLKDAAVAGGFPVMGPLLTLGGSTPGRLAGDVNNDGKVTVADVILVLQSATGQITLTPDQRAAADVNGDGRVDVRDATALLGKIVGR